MSTNQPVVISASKQARISAPKGGRNSLFVQNLSAFAIYISEDTPLTPNTLNLGILIAANQFYSVDQTQAGAVPSGTIYLLGSQVADQNAIVKEG